MKNYIARNIDPDTFVYTDVESNIPETVFDCICSSLKNLPSDHKNSIPQCDTKDGSVSFAFKSDGRWFKLDITPLK
jgi:hypothetical protein